MQRQPTERVGPFHRPRRRGEENAHDIARRTVTARKEKRRRLIIATLFGGRARVVGGVILEQISDGLSRMGGGFGRRFAQKLELG